MAKIVLIVDDQPSNIDLLKGLMPANVKVKAAISAKMALKVIERQAPDLILLDVIMPEMGGFEMFQQLQTLPGGDAIPVVFVSGNDTSDDPEAQGAQGHLTKPVEPARLTQIMAQLGLHD